MKKIRMKRILGSVFVLFLLEIVLFFFISNQYMYIAGLLILNLILINRIFYLIKKLRYRMQKKLEKQALLQKNH